MKYIIESARTVEEAVEKALLELNLKREEVEIEVLDEGSKGFLGLIGTKDAEVRVTEIRDLEKMSKEFLGKIIESLGLNASIVVEEKKNNLFIDIRGINPKDKGIVIGKRGNTLDAIQYLLSIYINKDREEYTRVTIDIEGYRKKRENTLIRLAQRMAQKAISSKIKVKLEPMNPYERRIIHSTLQDYKEITTYSEGKDPFRRVVIQLK